MKKETKKENPDEKLIQLLEKQKRELVVRTLQKHEEIISEKAFTNKLITSLSDILIIINKEMDIIKVNREFTRSLGYDIEDIDKLNLRNIVSSEDFFQLKQLIFSGEFKNHEIELISATGRKFLASINGSAFEGGAGKNQTYILIARDKTEFHEMMSKVRESQIQLMHSGRLASLGEMAAGIAHELTQPLNAILLFARNSLRSLSDQDTRNELVEENLSFIVDRVKKASYIIKSLKSFARKTNEEKISVNINSLIRDILKFLDAQLRLSDIEVFLNLDENTPEVMAHNIRLEQVFLNIIQNAIQAMDKNDKPRLMIRTTEEIKFDPENLKSRNYVVASISDNGEGITPEIKERIFDPFFTTREVGSGMGLGLSIVERIIREHAGHINVESSPGSGSCFSIFLPSAERSSND